MKYDIDYDAVIQDFFAKVDSMLKRNIAKAKIDKEQKAINKNISRIMMLSNNPEKFTDLRLMEVNDLFVTSDGFGELGTRQREWLFQAYNSFIDCVRQYYNSQNVGGAKKQILFLYKDWKQFAGCDNCVSNFVYNNLKPELFALKFKTKKVR